MKKIIISADDYGLDENFNLGIIYLLKNGLVSSVSVMINRKFIFPKELLDIKNISIGLHLEDNKFFSFKKQIEKFIKVFGKNPSHLDGHLHCHLRLENRAETIRLAKKYGIPVRSRFKKGRNDLINNNIKTPERLMDWHPKRKEGLFRRLKENNKKIIELVCHPGYLSKKYKNKYNLQRELELDVLKSKKLVNILKKYKLINYNKL